MRKIISALLAFSMIMAGGFGFFYMAFHTAEPVALIIWAIPISVCALGFALLWEDLTEFLKRR